MKLSPDPLLSASIYCTGRLDQVVHRIVVPFWSDLALHKLNQSCHLWYLRYRRCGEHIKLRVHGPKSHRSLIGRLLSARAESYFASLDSPESAEMVRRRWVPPIDAEDHAKTDYPDHTLLWTEYQRSHIVLGDRPFLDDDRYVSLFTRCLARGCESVMASSELDDGGGFPHRRRQTTLLRMLSAGLAVWASPEERQAFLTYHRDWAIRMLVLRSHKGPAKAREILARYDGEAGRMKLPALDKLRAIVGEPGACEADEPRSSDLEVAWQHALMELRLYLDAFKDDPCCNLDPFSRGPVFSTFSRVFHSIANQLGLNALNEGLAHHLLLHPCEAECVGEAFVLVPEVERYQAAFPANSDPQSVTGRARFYFEGDYRWWDLVAASGPGGQHWLETYRDQGREVNAWIKEALTKLRARQLEDGYRLLARADERRQSLRATQPSIFYVLGRFYFGALAYYFHSAGETRVSWAMDQARASIRRGIDSDRCLLPFAALSTDIPMKRARIARDQRRWREVRTHLATLWNMMADQQPLCVLGDGTAIYHSTIGESLAALPALDEQHQPAIQFLLDEAPRLEEFHELIENLYSRSSFFIPYP